MALTIPTGGPIAFGFPPIDLPSLYDWIKANLARTDLDDYLEMFVRLAEDWLNYGSEMSEPLRCREMETSATLTPDADGICFVPTDFIQNIRCVELGSVRRILSYITSDEAENLYPSRQGGIANHFTIVGSQLYTLPLTTNDIEFTYFQQIPSLGVTGSNWLLDKSPSVYLRAALVQAYDFIKDAEEFNKQVTIARALIAGLNRSDMVGKYARAGLSIRGYTP